MTEQQQQSSSALDLFRVDGLVAVVTGAGSGIGLTIAKTLALNGAAKVYIVGRRLEKLQETAALSPHGNIIPIQGDVTSKVDLEAVVARVKEEVGYLNLAICNSGIGGPHFVTLQKNATPEQLQKYVWENWTQEGFTETFHVNVTSVFFSAIAFLDLLDLGNKKGNLPGVSSQVIITASIGAFLRQIATGFAYLSSKSAVNHLAKALSTHFGRYNIRVNTLNPGTFPTEMTKRVIDYKIPGFAAEDVPANRLGEESDLVGATLYLTSRAGAYLNGLALVIDGGALGTVPATY